MQYKVINKNYKNDIGDSSRRVLIRKLLSFRILKFTDLEEIRIKSSWTPKLYSINKPDYFPLNIDKNEFIYEYKYISGKQLNES